MSLEAHLDQVRQEGTFHSEGNFTLDREKALERLADFSLESPLHVLLPLVGWLTHDGVSPVDLEIAPRKLTIRRSDSQLTSSQLERLQDYLFASGKNYGLSRLALSQHIWSEHGQMSVKVGNIKRTWEEGASRLESGDSNEGVELEFQHSHLSKNLAQTIDFLGRFFAWTPFPWTLNKKPTQVLEVTHRDWITLNIPPLPGSLTPSVALTLPETNFHLLCRWQSEGFSQVVVDGTTYPLTPPLCQGMHLVVFDQSVQTNITQTEAIVKESQRKQWSEALDFVTQEFFRHAELWNRPSFLKAHRSQLIDFVWPNLHRRLFLRVANAMTSQLLREQSLSLLNARLQIKNGDYATAFDTISHLPERDLREPDRRYLRDLENDFIQVIAANVPSAEDMQEIYSRLPDVGDLDQSAPNLLSQLCLQHARYQRKRGKNHLAEIYYLESYFLPRHEKNVWPRLLPGASMMDFATWNYPKWTTKIDAQGDYLEGLLELIRWAQERQSAQEPILNLLRDKFYSFPQEWYQDFLLLRFESWRLKRRQAQTEWFKWLLMSLRRNWKPAFPPLSHDEQCSALPLHVLQDSPRAKLLQLRCHTVYLEYSALALRTAKKFDRPDETRRFKALLQAMKEKADHFSPGDDLEALIELARINIDLQRKEQAEELLRTAISRIPAGEMARLPLLVDLAILQPQGADSVLRGLCKVLHISESWFRLPLDIQVERFASVVPSALPSALPPALPCRLRRLAWELSGSKELRAYRLARLLFHRDMGPPSHEPSEQNWVLDAIKALTE